MSMVENRRGYLSDELCDFFETSDTIATAPDLDTNNAAQSTIKVSSDSGSQADDPYAGFRQTNNDPNEGMVIIQMDNGGPRLKRTKATEIVIPLDHMSSSESIYNPDDSDSSIYSDVSSDTEDVSPVQSDDDGEVGPEDALRTEGCTSLSSPTKSGQLEPDSAQSSPVSDGQESGEEDTADEEGEDYENSAQSQSSDDTSSRSSSDGSYRKSFKDICRKFKHVTAELAEIAEAREQIGRQIIRSQYQNQTSSFMAMRMFSSMSANNRLKNIGYIDMDAALTARSTSVTAASIFNRLTPAVGDTFETHHRNIRETSTDITPTENSGSSPVCSTRFDFTPAARSKIEGTITAWSDNRGRSVESGRKNPQAKQDGEVRFIEPKERQFADLQLRQPRKVLPPISKGVAAGYDYTQRTFRTTEKCPTPYPHRTKQNETITTSDRPSYFHTFKQCKSMKPGIPHQLRSVACYQDGKVDVSIAGDKRILPEDDQLNVNITFVHRQNTDASKNVKVAEVADDKKAIGAKNVPFPSPLKSYTLPKSTKSLPPLRHPLKPWNNNLPHQNQLGYHTRSVLQGKHLVTKKDLPPLRNVPEKLRKNVQSTKPKNTCKTRKAKTIFRKCDYLNWDIVNDRAQRPPFNTHTNPEASDRHQKFFANITA